VSSSDLEAYLKRLGEELRRRWLDEDRLVAEAREHLVDRIDDGMRRGLSRVAAEQEAFRSFGAPETIAACSVAERYPMGNRWGFLGMVWDRKWSVLIPTIAVAAVASSTSYYVLPVRYQSEAFLEFTPASSAYIPDPAATHIKGMSDALTSPTRLERIIEDLNLYERERQTTPIDSVVRQMRHDISVIAMPDEQGTDVRAFLVRFEASDPRLAQRGTERLASLFIQEHLTASELRQTAARLKIVEPPRAPAQPVGPRPGQLGAIGGGVGLVLGLVFIASARRRA
jgi:uncharacterized protein involved in exopolysaccharide biosynthesis